MNRYYLILLTFALPLAAQVINDDSHDWYIHPDSESSTQKPVCSGNSSTLKLGVVQAAEPAPLKKTAEPKTQRAVNLPCLLSGSLFGLMSATVARTAINRWPQGGSATLSFYSLACATVSYQLLKNSVTTKTESLEKLSAPTMTAANDYSLNTDAEISDNDWMSP